MIYIDFQGGAHGNFLDFVCNKYLANVPCNELPFNYLGASHSKTYDAEKHFHCWHYSDFHGVRTDLYNSKIISIQITTDDLLPLQSVSLLRAGNHNIDNDQLEINTYHKFDNADYRWVLDNIIESFFTRQIQESYDRVKDSSWPTVTCMQDFLNLPEWIRRECLEQHNLKLLQLDAEHPDCPRPILREFFKISFREPEQSGFMFIQQKMVYDPSNEFIVFPFSNFYNTSAFIKAVEHIAEWTGYTIQNPKAVEELHQEFLNRQPYKDSKKFCDAIIKRIINREVFEFPRLDLLQESYISGRLEKHFGCIFPADQDKWFTNSREILDLLV